MYEIKVDEAETLCPECGKLLRGIRVRQSGAISASVFEAILADYRGCYPRLSVDTDGWLLAEECQTNHTAALPATSPETDRAALVALYHATDGPNWRLNENWVSEAPMGVWHGVKTDANGRVIHLDLGGNGLSGWIPRELGNLANLTEMRISRNRLSGEIPSEFGNLVKLIVLDLESNGLSGWIPRELGNLANLKVIFLSGNQLNGGIPPKLGNLANMKWLSLGHNQLSGEIPSELSNLANLEWLSLCHNQLSGEIPSELGNLANLESLSLFNNQLSGEIPRELGNLANLKSLDLYSNRLTGCVPRNLQDQLGFSYLGFPPFCPE